MVARTLPTNSLKKGILRQIHQPLPLTQRESQQLLQSITTSFRKNLDREHPWQASATSAEVQSSPEASTQSTTRHHATAQHLHTILSNPLFARPQNAEPGMTTSVGPIEKHFNVFDSAVSKGLMTPRRATGFLAAVRSEITARSSEGISERITASGAGVRVLRWLRSSGYEKNFDFLSEPALVKLLVYFLHAEGLQEVVWDWLARLAAPSGQLDLQNPGRDMSRLLSAIANESSGLTDNNQASLDGAYTALAKANDMFPREYEAAATALRVAWCEVSWASTVEALEHPKPTTTLFEGFMDVGRPFRLHLHSTHLHLHHPTTPSVSPAIGYLRNLHLDVSSMRPHNQQHILCLVLDLINRIGDSEKLDWLLHMKNNLLAQLNIGVLDTDYQIRKSLTS